MDEVRKKDRGRLGRLLRLVLSTLDPRAWAHLFRLVNYYNYTHVQEVRQLARGQGVRISPTASFANARNITLGDRVRVGANCSLWAGPGRGRIVLGADVLMAPNVMITAANYRFNEGAPVTAQAMDEADILIGRDVWLGYGVIVLPGAEIGDGAIIAAGAVVRGKVPAFSIAAGVPARVVGQRRTQPE